MHRKLDMTRARARSTIALAVAALIACTTLVVGCSDDAPTPQDQRDKMVELTQVVIAEVFDDLEISEPVVVDDGSEPVECPDGRAQYRYAVEGTTGTYAWLEDDAEEALYDAGTMITGVLVVTPEGRPFVKTDDTWSDPDWNGDRTMTYRADEGAASGMSLIFDLTADTAVTMDVRIAGTTTCG